jgi:hypothetical protein
VNRRNFLLTSGALAGAAALPQSSPERPANAVRSVQRLFTSETEDKPWFYDREMWPRYLDMLAKNRFSRFNLSFGIGYDFLRAVTDAYFLFAYPFFLSVPGYNVRATNLPDAERNRNLETLRFISEQTAAKGMEFQLGIWMHGYQWENSPHPNYTIEGLNAENHGPYCRDALAALLRACPGVRRHPSYPRREWRRRRQLSILERRLRGREALRPQGRDRHARQGHRPGHDRPCPCDWHARQSLAEVLG